MDSVVSEISLMESSPRPLLRFFLKKEAMLFGASGSVTAGALELPTAALERPTTTAETVRAPD